MIGAKNQGGPGGTNLCPECSATNITIRDSIVNSANYFGAFSLNANGNGAVAAAQNNISVHDVVADNLGGRDCDACTSREQGRSRIRWTRSNLGGIHNHPRSPESSAFGAGVPETGANAFLD